MKEWLSLVMECKKYKDNKPVLVGGIGEINFGKQYRQGNEVINDEE